MSYIQFEDVTKSFGKNLVLDHVNLEIGKGELVTLLGPSGCGKSTLLRCLAGLENATAGEIYLDGRNITALEPQKRDIGMVFQQYSLFPNLTVEQNVAFGLKLQKKSAKEIREKVKEILEVVGLADKQKQYPSRLSGGQQQRAALARAIVTEPKVLLLDEPLSAIDALLRRSLQIEIRRIQKELDITMVFVTHDQEEAMVMSDTIHLLYQGRIEQSAAPTELYRNPATRFAASFIGSYNLFSADEFERLSGEKAEGENIAFRPETVKMSTERPGLAQLDPAVYLLRGRIIASLPHGNILRYAVNCGGYQVKVDELFSDDPVCGEGQECWLAVRKEDCVFL